MSPPAAAKSFPFGGAGERRGSGRFLAARTGDGPAGAHTRSSVGVLQLPKTATVELALIATLEGFTGNERPAAAKAGILDKNPFQTARRMPPV